MSDSLVIFINLLKTNAHFKNGGILEEYANFMRKSISLALLNVELSFPDIMVPIDNYKKHLEIFQEFLGNRIKELNNMRLAENAMEYSLAEDRYHFMNKIAEEINEKKEMYIQDILMALTFHRSQIRDNRRKAKQYCRRLINDNRNLSHVINDITKLYRDTIFAMLIQIENVIITRFWMREEWLNGRYQPLPRMLCHGIEPSSMYLNLW